MDTKMIDTPYGVVEVQTIACSKCGKETLRQNAGAWFVIRVLEQAFTAYNTGLVFTRPHKFPFSDDVFCSFRCLNMAFEDLPVMDSIAI